MTYDNLAAKLNSQNWDLDLTTAEARQAATFLRRAADVQRWATEPWSQAAAEDSAFIRGNNNARAHVRALLAGARKSAAGL